MHNPQRVSGVGLATGAKYQGVGAFIQDESNVKVGAKHSSVANMRLIGQGPGNNLVIHSDFHITVLATGEVTSFHDNFSMDCK
jgi:hypothetical protein